MRKRKAEEEKELKSIEDISGEERRGETYRKRSRESQGARKQ